MAPFAHATVTMEACFIQVIKHTGYLGGLYTPEELNSENVKVRLQFVVHRRASLFSSFPSVSVLLSFCVESNVKDKGSKIAFLQKAVDVVGERGLWWIICSRSRDHWVSYLAFTLGQQVSCRPSKVVAGHEPERTNEFLQLLAAAIIDNV